MDSLDFWRLNDDLSIVEAALLAIGYDPGGLAQYVEQTESQNQPTGYAAARNGIAGGLRKGLIEGSHVQIVDLDWNGNPCGDIPNSVDPQLSRVDVESLKAWLGKRGVQSGFFFPPLATNTGPEYLDPKHPRYAPKLAAAVSAWLAVTEPKGKTPKQALDKWLREHAAEFGMVNDEGNPVEAAVTDCSKLANWEPGGGAPKTPGS